MATQQSTAKYNKNWQIDNKARVLKKSLMERRIAYG